MHEDPLENVHQNVQKRIANWSDSRRAICHKFQALGFPQPPPRILSPSSSALEAALTPPRIPPFKIGSASSHPALTDTCRVGHR